MYNVLDSIPFRSSDAILEHQEFLTGKKIIVMSKLILISLNQFFLFSEFGMQSVEVR